MSTPELVVVGWAVLALIVFAGLVLLWTNYVITVIVKEVRRRKDEGL